MDDFFKNNISTYQMGAVVWNRTLYCKSHGEFGAVSVLSGHLRGLTNTLPLHVEILFNEFQYVSAFAVSSILVIMAIILLVIRSIMEYKGKKEEEA